jgi:replicative DNA helicase
LLYETNIKLTDFGANIWKVYFAIISGLVLVEKKNVIDEVVVGLYLEKHLKLRDKYEEYGGWDTILNATTYVKPENLEAYIHEQKKWNAVVRLAKSGFPVGNRLSEYSDMTAEGIYDELEALLNHTFLNVDSQIKSYDISEGLNELINELDKGFAIGLPYYNLPTITKESGGQYLGSITLVGGLSNVGKSSFARISTLPSIINNNEKIVIMLNEESIAKWQREMLVYVCNVILKYDIQKYVVRDGKYTDETKEQLHKAAEWIRDKAQKHTITVIPFQSYETSKAIKVIKKYASMGVKYFILDTFKMDTGTVAENSWLQMAQAMVSINDVVKPESKNLHIMITFQLAKGSAKQRHYTQDNTGVAKNIIDVASTCLMIRDLYSDEYDGEKRELKVYRLEGKNGLSKIPVKLDSEKHYQLVFIVKNREGAANQYQIVLEVDMSRNKVREVGITQTPVDW